MATITVTTKYYEYKVEVKKINGKVFVNNKDEMETAPFVIWLGDRILALMDEENNYD